MSITYLEPDRATELKLRKYCAKQFGDLNRKPYTDRLSDDKRYEDLGEFYWEDSNGRLKECFK